MKRKAVIAAAIAFSLVLVPAIALHARPFAPGFRDGRAGIGGLKVLLELNLTEDQRLQVMNILNRYEGQREILRHDVMGAGRNVAKVLRAESFDEEKTRKAFGEASAVREEMLVLRAKMIFEIKAVLTPEQLQLLQEKRRQGHDRIKEHLQSWSDVTGE